MSGPAVSARPARSYKAAADVLSERDPGCTGFWHETYFLGGQIESVYIDMPPTGLAKFAPVTPARGSLFSARRRLGMREGNEPRPGIAEEELYRRVKPPRRLGTSPAPEGNARRTADLYVQRPGSDEAAVLHKGCSVALPTGRVSWTHGWGWRLASHSICG
jgi:hypothetical protein